MLIEYRKWLVTTLISLAASTASFASGGHEQGGVVTVSDPASLVSALARAKTGRRILLQSGTYELSQNLYVPDGVTIIGEAAMQFDSFGLPVGIEPAGRAVLKATPGLIGDVVTLGDRTSMRNLVVEDVQGRLGNVVVLSSRTVDDTVSASIEQCEIVNPNPGGAAPTGPRGRAVLVMTRNVNLGADPPPHDGSNVSLDMTKSLVHSRGGGSGVFAINFSSRSRVAVFLGGNVIGGGLDASAGASRPDPVSDSSTTIWSSENLYRSDTPLPTTTGWLLGGGTDAPVPGLVAGAATSNRLRIKSIGDRIEGFLTGVLASAGRRNSPTAGPSSMNELELDAVGLVLATSTADMILFGARSLVPGIATGDGNVLRLKLIGATGSGTRDNLYLPSSNFLGDGNRLEVVSNPTAYGETNQSIIPSPPPELFTSR